MADGKFKMPIIVAEVSINHLGMVKFAKIFIDECEKVGVDYIKLKMKDVQRYYADEFEEWRGYNFKEYRSSLELSKQDFKDIDEYCKDKTIGWYATVHDEEVLDFISQFNPPFYKLASMDNERLDFLDKILETASKDKASVVVSLGGKTSEWADVIVDRAKKRGVGVYVLHCVSTYPTPIEDANMLAVTKLRERFKNEKNVHIGYSGHEEGYLPTLLAVQQGAEMIERHVCLSKNLQIHHIKAGLTIDEFRDMMRDIRLSLKMFEKEFREFDVKELEFLKKRVYE
ncbi:MAG TPA: hypothetical protein ENH85_09135 [Candidatus Scalindua sp.]|nr:hypothetical protein [Candidatus Scalindua sp.]